MADQEKPKDSEKEPAKKAAQDDDVVGKAYDGRLMRRLLTYLRPYKLQTALSALAILFKAGSDVLGPYLVKIAVDTYMTDTPPAKLSWVAQHLSRTPMTGITQIACLYLGALLVTYVLEFLQTYLMQWTGQKIMFDLRSQIFRHLQRMHPAFFDHNPVGKLVTRVTSDVDALNKKAWSDAIFAYALYYPIVELLSSTAIALVIWRGGASVLHGTVTLGILIAFMQYAQRFFRPIQDLSEKYNILQAAMAASERVFKLLDSEPEIVSPAHSVAGDGLGRVEFRNVWFTYQRLDEAQQARLATATDEELNGYADIEWILRGVSFTIEPDETAAIVGHTGAGKTTITSLMMRFYDIQRGTILIDGVDVRQHDLNQLRRRFGVVLQDPFLFTGTVADNIRLGSKWITDERLERAADEVNVGDFIRSLPLRFAEPVRERGATLSTGQKQLISFARALAHDPGILILDEATSSVDTDTELRVRLALSRMITGRTSVLIAHRLSTIQRADTILVMHKGQLRERGTHQELLAHRGLYWKLYQLQYRDQELGTDVTASLQPLSAD